MSSPKPISVAKGTLEYKRAEVRKWTRLVEPTVNTCFNVRKLLFSSSVQLAQWNDQQSSRCDVGFKVTSAHAIWDAGRLKVECTGVEVIFCTCDLHHGNKIAGIAAAELSLLSTFCHDMTALKLTFPAFEVKGKTFKQKSHCPALCSKLETLLTQPPPLITYNNEALYVQEVFKTLLDKSITQQKKLHIEERCRIKASLHPAGKQIVV